MVSARAGTAVVGVVLSLLVSVVLWQVFGTPVFFFAVPFVPFLFRSRDDEQPVRACPRCGFTTRNGAYEFCPRDGSELETR
jgi:hypothetical protein